MFKIKNHRDDSFFNDVYGKKLDKYQKKVILDNSNELLVIIGVLINSIWIKFIYFNYK